MIMEPDLTIDPKDLLAFMISGETMTTEQIESRWPEWHKLRVKARGRYDAERAAYRLKWRSPDAEGSSDPMVSSVASAVHKWCYASLIADALEERSNALGLKPVEES